MTARSRTVILKDFPERSAHFAQGEGLWNNTGGVDIQEIQDKSPTETTAIRQERASTTGLRVLKAIGDAVPVRLMKRALLFLVERLAVMLDERKLALLIRQHGIGKHRRD